MDRRAHRRQRGRSNPPAIAETPRSGICGRHRGGEPFRLLRLRHRHVFHIRRLLCCCAIPVARATMFIAPVMSADFDSLQPEICPRTANRDRFHRFPAFSFWSIFGIPRRGHPFFPVVQLGRVVQRGNHEVFPVPPLSHLQRAGGTDMTLRRQTRRKCRMKGGTPFSGGTGGTVVHEENQWLSCTTVVPPARCRWDNAAYNASPCADRTGLVLAEWPAVSLAAPK